MTAATTAVAEAAEAATPVAAGVSWAALVLALWSAGAAVSLGWLLVAVVRLRRLVANAAIVEDVRWRRALDAVCRDAALRRPVRLLVAPQALLLATWGWRRPRVVIPACGLGWSDERVRTVLAHEVAHVVRRDWLLQSVAETLRAALVEPAGVARLSRAARRQRARLRRRRAPRRRRRHRLRRSPRADCPHRRSRQSAGGGPDADGSCLHPGTEDRCDAEPPTRSSPADASRCTRRGRGRGPARPARRPPARRTDVPPAARGRRLRHDRARCCPA